MEKEYELLNNIVKTTAGDNSLDRLDYERRKFIEELFRKLDETIKRRKKTISRLQNAMTALEEGNVEEADKLITIHT